MFNEAYDYKEQARVHRALRELNKRNGNDLWPRLFAHFDDDRYAFTYFIWNGETDNATVGNMCRVIAHSDLTLAFQRHSPRNPKAHSLGSRWLVRAPELRSDADFQDWLDERKGKKLYELQIDLCQWAIDTPYAVEFLSPAQTREFTQKVTKQIETLKKTHKPVVDKQRFEDTYYSLYSAERMKQLRDEYDNEPKASKDSRSLSAAAAREKQKRSNNAEPSDPKEEKR